MRTSTHAVHFVCGVVGGVNPERRVGGWGGGGGLGGWEAHNQPLIQEFIYMQRVAQCLQQKCRATHIMPISPPIMLCLSAPIVSPIVLSQLPPTMLIVMLTFQDIVVDSNKFIA